MFEASDLCTTKTANTTVFVRCPPRPTASLTTASATIKQNNKAALDASASKANFVGGTIKTYAWALVSAPTEANFQAGTIAGANGNVYQTPNLPVAGVYSYEVTVFDGCSMHKATICVTVECNCGPTANAGATSTVWTNTPTGFQSDSMRTDNKVDLNNGPSYKLDGSLSYDFDKNPADTLTYSWDFVEWQAMVPEKSNSMTWVPSTNNAATDRIFGYQSSRTVSGGAGATNYVLDYKFTQLARTVTSSDVRDPLNPTGVPQRTTPTAATAATGFPKTCPAFIQTEEEFAWPTTSYHATITRTVATQDNVLQFTQTRTVITPQADANVVLCSIRITQRASENGVTYTTSRNNPMAWLTLSGLAECRGLWRFSLTVTDGCGSSTQSVDTIRVNVRCNEPPVAIACANNTQAWQGSAFDQVRVDGRSSNDPDNSASGALTYTWTFFTTPAGHCPQQHKACVETYCNNPDGFMSLTATQQGPTFNRAFGGANTDCSPTVFPMIQDRNRPTPQGCTPPNQPLPGNCPGGGNACSYCTYAYIAPTQYHVGNSAYFTPTRKGTYHVILTVDDGCSKDTDEVMIWAECPALTVDFSMNPASSVSKAAGQNPTVTLTATVSYLGTYSSLSYAWSFTRGAGNVGGTATFSAQAAQTTATLTDAGIYNFVLTVTDQCQTVTTAAKTFTVQCNASPANLVLSMADRTANLQYFSGTAFSQVIVEASAVDTDPITYSFSFATGSSSAASNNPAANRFAFTPVPNLTNQTYTVNVVASDGCTSSTVQSIQIQALCNGTISSQPGASKTVNYDPTNQATPFAAQTFDGSASVFPYGNVANSPKNYLWSARYFATANVGTDVSANLYSGQNTAQFTIRADRVGSYQITLRVDDTCSQSTQSTTLVAVCATVSRASVTVSPRESVVYWDSYKANAAGFADFTLDGSASTGYRDAQLTYQWGIGTNPCSAGQTLSLSSTTAASVTFNPPCRGTYTFTLFVQNGPCPASSQETVTVRAVCHTLTAVLRAFPGTNNQQTVNYGVTWDGTKFPIVTLDGTGSTYVDQNNRQGNFNRLTYTWTMTASPVGSCYLMDVPSVNTVVGGSARKNEVTTTVFRNDTYSQTTLQWQDVTPSTTTTTVTTFKNHHYNMPHTCFKPDVAGTYGMQLRISDGCTEATASAVITVSCQSPPTVNVNAVPTVTLSGNQFKRVDLQAQVTFSPNEELTYKWTLVTKPVGSNLRENSMASITNSDMPMASFVPDRAGTYTFSFMANDGCSAAVTRTVSVAVTCGSTMTVGTPQTSPAFIDWVGGANDQGMNNFGNKEFTLTGTAETPCQVLNYRWTLLSRVCSPPFLPTGTPPPTAAPVAGCKACDFTCTWSTDTTPCTDVAVNAGYTAPVLTADAANACKATFEPKYPGTYRLKLVVKDCCSWDTGYTQVVAKCSTTPTASAGRAANLLYTCATGQTTWAWQSTTLSGSGSTAAPAPDPKVVATCPAAAATPAATCTDEIKTKCCPATGSCCQYQCPMCPQCPECPACPSRAAAAAAASYYTLPQYTQHSFAGRAQETKPRALSSSVLMSVVVPILALVVLSVSANVVMIQKIRARKHQL